jgi:ERCC4-type nuclease
VTVFVSPSEPAAIKTLGPVSSLPETYGADVLLIGKWGVFGIQRKEIKDLVNSIRGDRVAKEIGQMGSLNHAAWIVEGKWNWTADGISLAVPSFTIAQYYGALFYLSYRGYAHYTTDTIAQTCELITRLRRWLEKEDHGSLMSRSNPQNSYGRITNKDWGCHLLQSFDGISYKLAGAIYDYFGGVPMSWNVTIDELMLVPGIGPKRAETLWEAMQRDDSSKDS